MRGPSVHTRAAAVPECSGEVVFTPVPRLVHVHCPDTTRVSDPDGAFVGTILVS